jgi:2-iminoacetate synthase
LANKETMTPTIDIIDPAGIQNALDTAVTGKAAAREVLAVAHDLKGLTPQQAATLICTSDPEVDAEIFENARSIKETIYGKRLVLFAPLYISNYCSNECSYCAFRKGNKEARRRALNQEELAREVKALVEQGHKRILMVSGEAYPNGGFDYILDSIRTIYATRSGNGEIRRVNVNLAPCTLEEFHLLHEAEIGTYQIFQETYHRPTYEAVHLSGPKRNFEYRLSTPHRAMEGGINDVGIGPLLGLYDWRFEILAVLEHACSLERVYGCGPHTISVPRIEPAAGSALSLNPTYAVSDADFLRIVAILRLAVPYTGLIMSTRESAPIRRETFKLGISQISGGSRTDPGGYTEEGTRTAQFQLGDHRPLDEVIRDVAALGYIPSFCTACYRLGRTGSDFMDLAKPGEIKNHCAPNALSTLQEYLDDYASPETRAIGEERIECTMRDMESIPRRLASHLVRKVQAGERDVFL